MSIKRSKNKSTRVLISLPEKFLEEIDELADEEQRSRSELIREALRNYIRSNEVKLIKTKDEITEILE